MHYLLTADTDNSLQDGTLWFARWQYLGWHHRHTPTIAIARAGRGEELLPLLQRLIA